METINYGGSYTDTKPTILGDRRIAEIMAGIGRVFMNNKRIDISTIVVEDSQGRSVLFRQIAGALARRIVYYCKIGDTAQQAQQMGFIKFGSRVDLFLPLGTKICVKPGQHVKGSQTVLAEW